MAANYNYLRKHNLVESLKDFRRISKLNEYSNFGLTNEEDEDEAQGGDPNAMGGDPMAQGGDPNAMGGDPMAQGGDPNAMGGDPMAQGGDPNAMGGDPMAQGGDPNAMGGDPMAQGGDPNMMGGEPMAPIDGPIVDSEDDVIDVDDLTNAQEKMNAKVNRVGQKVVGFDDKFSNLMKMVDTLQNKLDTQSKELNAFKQEFAKRNPTPKEKLEQRAKSSFPFTQTIEDYWKSNKPDNYDLGDETVYEIDLDDISDMSDTDMERSLRVNENYKWDIKKIFS